MWEDALRGPATAHRPVPDDVLGLHPSFFRPPTARGLLTDSYISDVHLRFHPPVIALACLLVTAQLREKDLADWLATLRLDLGMVRGAR